MKGENFEAAAHFYGKAIELNPANAVYFCNRCQPGSRGAGTHVGPGQAGRVSPGDQERCPNSPLGVVTPQPLRSSPWQAARNVSVSVDSGLKIREHQPPRGRCDEK